jgi:hypothetical protein
MKKIAFLWPVLSLCLLVIGLASCSHHAGSGADTVKRAGDGVGSRVKTSDGLNKAAAICDPIKTASSALDSKNISGDILLAQVGSGTENSQTIHIITTYAAIDTKKKMLASFIIDQGTCSILESASAELIDKAPAYAKCDYSKIASESLPFQSTAGYQVTETNLTNYSQGSAATGLLQFYRILQSADLSKQFSILFIFDAPACKVLSSSIQVMETQENIKPAPVQNRKSATPAPQPKR